MKQITSMIKRTTFLCFFLLFSMCMAYPAEIITLENGDQVSWDGSYYDFRAADGVKMIKMWIPPNTSSTFVSTHPKDF